MTQLVQSIRSVQDSVDAIVGVEALRQKRLSEILKVSNYSSGGSLDAGAGTGVVDLAA